MPSLTNVFAWDISFSILALALSGSGFTLHWIQIYDIKFLFALVIMQYNIE